MDRQTKVFMQSTFTLVITQYPPFNRWFRNSHQNHSSLEKKSRKKERTPPGSTLLLGAHSSLKKSTFGSRLICQLNANDIVGVNPGKLLKLPITPWKRTADVVCQADVETFFISIKDYNEVLAKSPELFSILTEEQKEQQIRQFVDHSSI